MSLRVTFGGFKPLGASVWTGTLSPTDVRRFGDGRAVAGARSIVGVLRPEFDPSVQSLSVRPDHIAVLSIGSTDETLIFDLGDAGGTEQPAAAPPAALEVPLRAGDAEFLADCRLHLGTALVEVAEALLQAVRRRFPGELREGLARKWVNHPDNFVAITIQNRDQSLAVHVKGAPQDFRVSSLDIKPDRGSYCRFKVSHPGQLREAIHVVVTSAERSVGG